MDSVSFIYCGDFHIIYLIKLMNNKFMNLQITYNYKCISRKPLMFELFEPKTYTTEGEVVNLLWE